MASLAVRHKAFTEAGAILAAISVDSPSQNAAMVEKLKLPFPILSDPDRSKAINPYGVADPKDAREIALPTTVVVDPEGNQVARIESRDFADRPEEDEVLELVQSLELWPTEQPSLNPGAPEPGPNAMPFAALTPYYRGAKFAGVAMSRRFPEAKEESIRLGAQMDRYIEAVHSVGDA